MVVRWSWLGDHFALDVANTVRMHHGRYVDLLATPVDLLEWSDYQTGRLPNRWPRDIAAEELTRVQTFRDHLLVVLRAVATHQLLPEQSVVAINGAARAAPTLRQLSPDGTATTQLLHDHDPIGGLIGLAADAAITLLGGPDRDRLALCSAPSCGQLYLRERTNQQWCSTGCGNRARGARHQARHATG